MSRRDDPLSNVSFVELIEKYPVLWNFYHESYNKKEATQKAWLEISNENRDSVDNNRNRWRTIRSSYFRSKNTTKTNKGREKRNYYLAKNLKFLETFTRSRTSRNRSKRNSPEQSVSTQTQSLNIAEGSNASQHLTSHDDNEELSSSEIDIGESSHMNQTDEEDPAIVQQRLANIKKEQDATAGPGTSASSFEKYSINNNKVAKSPIRPLTSFDSGIGRNCTNGIARTACVSVPANNDYFKSLPPQQQQEFNDWQKTNNSPNQSIHLTSSNSDSNQSFFLSLKPFIDKLSDNQNLLFRQDVITILKKHLDENNNTTGRKN